MGRPERGLPGESTGLTEFARRLRELRKAAGQPSYRRLATVTHYSAATLARAAGGNVLPSLAVTVAYATACGGDPDEWRAVWAEAAASARIPVPAAGGAPNPGRRIADEIPAQLPPDTADFTGRAGQVKLLCDLLGAVPTGHQPGAAKIAVVAGMGGIGKTALAVHVAHRVRHLFPDGQLFANLRGTTAAPPSPGALLGTFLRQLGADPASLPADLEERTAMYRSLLADRRVLLVFDDAHDAAQLRLLIPATSGCAVLVTMRNRASGLSGATHLDLGVLPRPDSSALLSRIVGAERVAAEPEAASAILSSCGDLPLAIRLAGARLVSRPGWKVQDLADRLDAVRHQLDELSFGDQCLRASFDVSYAGLSLGESAPTATTRAFCLLALWPGQDISLPAAAALLGEDSRQAERILEPLVDMYMVESFRPGRYSLHELLRAFAAERAEQELDESSKSMAITRLVTWYALAANAMDEMLAPARQRISVQVTPGVAAPPDLRTPAEAISWGESEHENLVLASWLSGSAGLRQLAWQLPTALWSFLLRQRHVRSLITTQEIALASALELKDETAEAMVRNNLAVAMIEARRFQDAIEHLEKCVSIRSSHGNDAGAAAALNNLGIALMEAGLPDKATGYLLRSLSYRRSAGQIHAQAGVHANLGNIHLLRGHFPAAIRHCKAAEKLYLRWGDNGGGRAQALLTMSHAYYRLGELDSARYRAEEVMAIYKNICDLHGLAETLRHLARIRYDLGDHDGARGTWLEALRIMRHLDDQNAPELEDRIAALTPHNTGEASA